MKQHSHGTSLLQNMAVLYNGSMWLGCNYMKNLLHIKFHGERTKVQSAYDFKIIDMAVSPLGTLYVVVEG